MSSEAAPPLAGLSLHWPGGKQSVPSAWALSAALACQRSHFSWVQPGCRSPTRFQPPAQGGLPAARRRVPLTASTSTSSSPGRCEPVIVTRSPTKGFSGLLAPWNQAGPASRTRVLPPATVVYSVFPLASVRVATVPVIVTSTPGAFFAFGPFSGLADSLFSSGCAVVAGADVATGASVGAVVGAWVGAVVADGAAEAEGDADGSAASVGIATRTIRPASNTRSSSPRPTPLFRDMC